MDAPLLVRALRGEPVERTPVWFMRQAGRYLPEYRAVREKVSFLDLCRDPELGLEVTRQPVERFGLDAAIVFSDILTVLEALGREVTFDPAPRLAHPVRTTADAADLRRSADPPALRTAPEVIRRWTKARPDVPILGFAGAPFTLLCYLVEGKGSKEWVNVKRLLWCEPALAHRLLDLLADVVGDHLQNQVDAGASAVQLFDTWAGALSPQDFERWALPAAQRALERVKGAPRIYFTKDTSPFLHLVGRIGADAIGLDWRVDVARAREVLGKTPIQGNLDPVALFAPPEAIAAEVKAILKAAGPMGHVFNLGHGILPETPIEGVEAMIAAVRGLR
jgi:uroporphyrinogen decarboxylase